MSEHLPTPEESQPKPRREVPWTALAGVVALGGFVTAGIAVSNSGPTVHAKHVYAGVSTQVEHRFQPTTRCSYTVGTGGACAQETTTYKMGLEQCPADVAAARQGRTTESIDRAVGNIGIGCISEVIQVPERIWNASSTGSIIVFDGPPARPLQD